MTIEVYGQEGCFYCKLTQDLLETKGLDFKILAMENLNA